MATCFIVQAKRKERLREAKQLAPGFSYAVIAMLMLYALPTGETPPAGESKADKPSDNTVKALTPASKGLHMPNMGLPSGLKKIVNSSFLSRFHIGRSNHRGSASTNAAPGASPTAAEAKRPFKPMVNACNPSALSLLCFLRLNLLPKSVQPQLQELPHLPARKRKRMPLSLKAQLRGTNSRKEPAATGHRLAGQSSLSILSSQVHQAAHRVVYPCNSHHVQPHLQPLRGEVWIPCLGSRKRQQAVQRASGKLRMGHCRCR